MKLRDLFEKGEGVETDTDGKRVLKMEIVSEDFARGYETHAYLKYNATLKKFDLYSKGEKMDVVSLGDLDLERLGLRDGECLVLSYQGGSRPRHGFQ